MNHNTQTFSLKNTTSFKQKMLNWANRFGIFCLLDNSQYTAAATAQQPAFECLLAVGCKKNIVLECGTAFTAMEAFEKAAKKQWVFGHLAYDLKNAVEKLHSANADNTGFADGHFFVPETVIKLSNQTAEFFCDGDAGAIMQAIESETDTAADRHIPVPIKHRMSHAEYTEAVNKLQQHILQGDCYEVNFCQEFYAENVKINPVNLYNKLIACSPNPFAALYKVNNHYCICASPERYIKKTGNKIISQPIKGTSKRDLQNADTDAANKTFLTQSIKERSENVMVVDLVRNDLSKICTAGSVQVDELFGVYSFPQVHQMISTVSGQMKEGVSFTDAVKATFPMGSMTGAPKKRVMQLIEQYEKTKRGLFSGSIGYINPAGDFDFNVVIRSIMYNAATDYLSYQTGSAITFYSDAAKEYEECLLKAAAIRNVLA